MLVCLLVTPLNRQAKETGEKLLEHGVFIVKTAPNSRCDCFIMPSLFSGRKASSIYEDEYNPMAQSTSVLLTENAPGLDFTIAIKNN